jgi:hypothetical protein
MIALFEVIDLPRVPFGMEGQKWVLLLRQLLA